MNEFLTNSINRATEFFVYSVKADVVRLTRITPRLGWGGKGCLGCGVGHGYLHALPKKTRHSVGSVSG